MPQKQPPASTAVCWPFVGASGASTDGLGMATGAPAALQVAPRPSGRTAARMANVLKKNRSMSDLLRGGRTDTLGCPVVLARNHTGQPRVPVLLKPWQYAK